MAAAAPFVKLLRQLSRAKDEYRSGALDITWDGGIATIYLVFGQPNHATFSDGAEELQGTDALAALVQHLPRNFSVSGWRKEVVRTESLQCTLDELMEPFAQLTGASVSSPEPLNTPASDFGDLQPSTENLRLEDFPLLPLGRTLWDDASASIIHLDVLIPTLPSSIIVLTAGKLRALAVIARGEITDALWVDDEQTVMGESAAMALMGARDGSISCYQLENDDMAEAIPLLWRCPPHHTNIPLQWLDRDKFFASLEKDRGDHAVVIVTPQERGVALLVAGKVIATYTESARRPTPSLETLHPLFASWGFINVLERATDQPSTHNGTQMNNATEVSAAQTFDDTTEVAGADVTEMTPTAVAAGPAEPSVAESEQREEAAHGGPFSQAAARDEAATAAGLDIDFEAIKTDLVQIGTQWLGQDDVAPVAASIRGTRHDVEDFVETIEKIKDTPVAGHDQSVIRSMAREMHYYAAEALCGA